MKKEINPFIGTWSIIEMEAWDQEYVNMEVPGHFTFKKEWHGAFSIWSGPGRDGLPGGNR